MNDPTDLIKQEGYSALGSLVALIFIGGTIWHKIFYFCGGWALSKLFGSSVHDVTGLGQEVSRSLTALFGLAIVEKVFDVISNFDAKRIAKSITDTITDKIEK